MNNTNYIIVSGPSNELLEMAVQQMADLYADTEYSQGIELYKSKNNKDQFIIRFAIDPDFERFKYFVNYLHYPKVQNYSARVLGYFKLNEEKIDLGELKNERLLLYVSDQDTEGDNVNGIFENGDKTIKFGFALGEEYKELGYKEFDFQEPEIKNEDYEHIKTLNGSARDTTSEDGGCLALVAVMVTFSGIILYLISI